MNKNWSMENVDKVKQLLDAYNAAKAIRDSVPNTTIQWRIQDDTMHDLRYQLGNVELISTLIALISEMADAFDAQWIADADNIDQ